MAFLTEVRPGVARYRIAETNDPLEQIAADVGYQSEMAPSRALNRSYDVWPGALRRRAQGAVEVSPETSSAGSSRGADGC